MCVCVWRRGGLLQHFWENHNLFWAYKNVLILRLAGPLKCYFKNFWLKPAYYVHQTLSCVNVCVSLKELRFNTQFNPFVLSWLRHNIQTDGISGEISIP